MRAYKTNIAEIIMPKVTFETEKDLDLQLDELLSTSSDTYLDISGNLLGRRKQVDLLAMAHEISLHGITSVNLASTGLQLINIDDLIDVIEAFKTTAVTSLDLSNNWLGITRPTADLERLVTALSSTHISEINLSDNGLGSMKNEDLKKILTKLSETNLKCIRLDGNQFDKLGGAYYIAELLALPLGKKAKLLNTDIFTTAVRDHMQDVFITVPDAIDAVHRIKL